MDSSNQDIKPKKTKGLRSKRQPHPFPPLRASGTVLVPNPFYASAITAPVTVDNVISDYAPSLNSEHTFSPMEMEVAEALIFLAHGVNHVSESYSKSKPKMHECTVCKKKFPSGQALGGHKRKHYEGRVIRKSAAGTRAMKKPKYK